MAEEEKEPPITIKGYYRWHNLPTMLFVENGEEKAEVFEPPRGYIPIPVAELYDALLINRFVFERMVDAPGHLRGGTERSRSPETLKSKGARHGGIYYGS